ncbi:MAG: membrane protein insertion efficiency factor YidD [Desulfovermiculus sp.]
MWNGSSTQYWTRCKKVCAEFRIRFLIRGLLIGLVRAYQRLVSPFFPASCRFIPSCSEYTLQALFTHGIFRGLGLALWRILRCHPLARGGYDPVPENRRQDVKQCTVSEKTMTNS